MFHWELCKNFQLDHTNKWHMHKPTSVLENETYKWIIGQTTRPCNKSTKKRTCQILDFAVLADHRVKLKKNEKTDKYLDLARDLKKLWNMKVTRIKIVINALSAVTEGLIKGSGGLGNKRMSGDHTNYCIIELGQNTEKSLGDLRKLAVTKSLVKDYQLTLMRKTPKE